MNIENIYQIYKQFPLVTTDSRVCPENSIFFALRGDNFNGNRFAQAALDKGCAYAVVDEAEFAGNKRIILVENVLETLQKLANLHRKTLGTKIIGITGTNGKTTTKELIAAILSQKFNTLYTQGNLNNHIGVPLTLLQLTANHEIAIIEMGANHPHEIAELCAIAEPNFGIVTNVGKAHLEGFGSFEGVMRTKAEIYDFISQKGGKVFINQDNNYLLKMAEDAGLTDKSLLKYSLTDRNATVYGKIISVSPFLQMNLYSSSQYTPAHTHLVGSYNAENLLAAFSVGHHFGVSVRKMGPFLEKYVPTNNRSQYAETQKNKLIIDAYNANPSSMAEAIRNFAQIEAGEKTLILGDMLELGETSAEEHQEIVNLLNENGFSEVFLVGKNFQSTKSDFTTFENPGELIDFLKDKKLENRLILIKGSHSMKMEKTVEFL
ncbi:UDP-N-acetylmuramoyl-tripeptide--D-alanyl-D-alanine ligase [Bacteroidia bacterium]|nr:UDP-N-acetylmuramoyl-tripeptide--D-alanyl-D-alanine ligase [Bacteroidia bacterium]